MSEERYLSSELIPETQPTPPFDDGGFVQSFHVSQIVETNQFLEKFGFVCFRDVLTAAEADVTFDEFWTTNKCHDLDRNSPDTWGKFWSSQRFRFAGIIGLMPDTQSIRQLQNRQNPNVHAAYASIFGTEKVIVDHDRLGVMRLTKGIVGWNGKDSGPRDKADWKTNNNWIHLDCNPVSHDGQCRGFASIGSFADSGAPIDFSRTRLFQSFLSLTDAGAANGGFVCIPGSQRWALPWARTQQENPQANKGNANMSLPEELYLRQPEADLREPRCTAVPIPVRKGCLVVWNSLLFHANAPNNSPNFRAVQYIRGMPVEGKARAISTAAPAKAPGLYALTVEVPPEEGGAAHSTMATNPTYYPADFQMTELGEKMFGVKQWDVG